MARVRDEEYRAELARTAFDAIIELGSVGVSMSAIAKQVGISRSLLYFYFPNQSAICSAKLEQLLRQNVALVDTARLQADDPLDELINYFDAVVEMSSRPTAEIVNLVRLLVLYSPNPLDILSRMEGNLEPYRIDLASRIDAGIERNTIKQVDSLYLVKMARALAEGLMIQNFTGAIDIARARANFIQTTIEPLRIGDTND